MGRSQTDVKTNYLPPSVTVVLLLLAGAGCTEPEADNTDVETSAVVTWVAGVTTGDPAFEFGRINGIATRGDSVFVADDLNHEVRVFTATADHLYTFGGEGDGPGALRDPCCLAFDARGRLWIWSTPGRRYDVFDPADDGTYLFSLRSRELGPLRTRRIVFDDEGNVIHPMADPEAESQAAIVRVTVDSMGAVLGSVRPPHVPPDSLGMGSVERWLGNERRTFWLGIPTTASHPLVHSPLDGYADAITSRYAVRWFDHEGAPDSRNRTTRHTTPPDRRRDRRPRGARRIGPAGVWK